MLLYCVNFIRFQRHNSLRIFASPFGIFCDFCSAPSSKEFSSLRPGNPTNDHMCNHVTSIPSHLTFITRYRHYQKYTHAYGIPIVSSGYVSDAALKRACYVLRFLLADLYKIRYYLYKVSEFESFTVILVFLVHLFIHFSFIRMFILPFIR